MNVQVRHVLLVEDTVLTTSMVLLVFARKDTQADCAVQVIFYIVKQMKVKTYRKKLLIKCIRSTFSTYLH